MKRLSTVNEWLNTINAIHGSEIDLGLDRVKEIAKKLDLLSQSCPLIIVGGTNGKGSTVYGLASIYRAANFRVGMFTSPMLISPLEQIKINGCNVTESQLCEAFNTIEIIRSHITLTPFEFFTLAALWIFKQNNLDVIILEVGLGGRLDAVNILDADLAIITSIDIDHVNYLGPTRDTIAYEKAGIFRSQKPAICGDFNPPPSLFSEAEKKQTELMCQGQAFHFEEQETSWSFWCRDSQYDDLPLNTLLIQNMATVLMAVTLMQTNLPVNRKAIDKGLLTISLPGRIQIVPGSVTQIYDVSHNPAAVKLLAKKIKNLSDGKTHAVFSMLADKDIIESIHQIKAAIHHWYVAPLLDVKRAASFLMLKEAFLSAHVQAVTFFSSIEEAYLSAHQKAKEGDNIVIFGSFHTVSSVMTYVPNSRFLNEGYEKILSYY